MTENFKINDPDDYYSSVVSDFELADSLDNGRKAMIAATTKYLPKESMESDNAYTVRLNRTDFFPGFSDCLDYLIAAVFKKDIIIDESAIESQKQFAENVDLQGNNISVFSKSLLRNAEKYGISYFIVEFPKMPEGGTLADEKKAGARPYWREVLPTSLIFLQSEIVAGQETLMDIRIKENITERVGLGIQTSEQIRRYIQIIENGQPIQVDWEVYRKKKGKEVYDEIPVETGTLNPMKRIPLIPVYTKPKGFYRGRWRLEHCAWLNVIHWQSSSDQRNILRITRCPILAHAGFFQEPTKKVEISPNTHQGTTRPDAKMWWVEHSGAAIQSGAEDLARLKDEMSQIGKNIAIKKTGSITATEAGINTAQSQSELQSDAKSLKDALENGFILNSEWQPGLNEKPPTILVNTEFGILETDSGNNQMLFNACTAGKLSTKTFLQEMKRRNLIAESVDIDEEMELIQQENASWMNENNASNS